MIWSDKVKWGDVPEHMHGGIIRYVERGVPPGAFLTAVFKNDFMEMCERADEENRRALFAYAKFLHNACPHACYGEPGHFQEWVRRGGIAGNATHEPLPVNEWSRWADQDYV